MIERKFIQRGTRNLKIEEFLRKELDNADFSSAEIKRTPLNTRITIHAGRPGMVIGRAGSKIHELTDMLKTDFGIDNPQIEVKEVYNPYLDAEVVAKQIVAALERRVAYRRIVNIMLKEVMRAGAIGVEIVVGGKLGGAMSRTERFTAGYLKKCGEPAVTCTNKAQAQANLKAGIIGIKVIIMNGTPDILALAKRVSDIKTEEQIEAEKKAAAEKQKADAEAKEKAAAEKKAEEKKAEEAKAAEKKKAESPADKKAEEKKESKIEAKTDEKEEDKK